MRWTAWWISSASATGEPRGLRNFTWKTDNRKPINEKYEGDELADRLIDFAVRIIALASRLPKDAVGRHIGSQMIEAGTSVGAHYEEARGAESKADFVHKLGIGLKECRKHVIGCG
jgi:hypothetical protein